MPHHDSLPHVSLRLAPDDGVSVRFPPGLGLIPPRDVPHPPRDRAEWAR